MRGPKNGFRKNAAFTLVESLVALAVLALIMGMLSQMLDTAERATHLTHQEVAASDYTRKVLDSMGIDFENLINVNGLTVLVSEDANKNTILAFPTESRPPGSQEQDTRFMAVAYQLSGNKVMRSTTAVPWTTSQVAAATAGAVNSSTSGVMASTGVRLVAVAMLDNGTVVPLTSSTLSAAQTWKTSTVNGENIPSGFYNLVLSSSPVDPNNPRVSGIVVGVATLDAQTIAIGNASSMGTGLSSPGEKNEDVTAIDVWEASRASAQFMQAYPRPAVSALSLGQQTYVLK